MAIATLSVCDEGPLASPVRLQAAAVQVLPHCAPEELSSSIDKLALELCHPRPRLPLRTCSLEFVVVAIPATSRGLYELLVRAARPRS